VTVLLSHAVDDAVGATWLCRDKDVGSSWRRWCRVMLATMLLGRLGHGTMYMLSYDGDNAVESY
jgi:hypothetical protein